MSELMDRITTHSTQGDPHIRGMRIRVINVLDLLASRLTAEQILEEMPDLEREDLAAAISFLTVNAMPL